MPSVSSSPFSLSRWWNVLFSARKKSSITDDKQDGGSTSSSNKSVENNINNRSTNSMYKNLWGQDDSPVYSSIECYACTQVTAPAFHSTSCDQANAPEWEACAGSSLVPIHTRSISKQHLPGITRFKAINQNARNRPAWTNIGPFGAVLDPRSKRVQLWNRAFLLARGVAIAIDPLFFYALSVGRNGTPCLYMDGALATVLTVLRTSVDIFHLWHLWLQFRLAYVSRESLVVGCGKLVWDARAIASHYLRSVKGFWFDLFVILPVPQVVFWLIVPRLIKQEQIKLVMTMLLLIFLFQFLPKIYHSICLMRRMQKVTGYIFGTIWWGFALNLIAYLMASHVAGGCWYVLAIQRVASCLRQQCERKAICNLTLSCTEEVCYQFSQPKGTIGTACGGNFTKTRKPLCLDVNGPFNFGIYKWALPVISSNSVAVKILYPIFWGLMTLSTFGNDLEPTSHWLEVMFSIIIVLAGLMLFTLLIGNIQVFLHAVMAKKRKMQLRCRDMEWWMRRRQLPSKLRKRVRQFERQRWVVMGGDDEMEMIQDLPEGLRRDIKRFLCHNLIKKVPLFHNLDDLIIDNICDRVKPLYFSKDEKIIREGDPVQRMIFIMRGKVKSSQNLSRGIVATSILEPGGFLGDELLSWCLRRPFIERLPASSATFLCIEPIEGFSLEANNLKYITDHFRYKFANERLKRTARYYSSNWRTWAAVNIQLAWRRCLMRTRGPVIHAANENGASDRRLRQCAAMFMSLRPHDHLE